MKYETFLDAKRQLAGNFGFEPTFMPDQAFPFQRALIEWAVKKGRAAVLADCGLGKTLIQLAWAENIARETAGRVLILTPLAVSHQTVAEAAKFGIEATRSNAGELESRIIVTNYERLHHFSPEDFEGVVCDESSILKHYTGATQKTVTRFMAKIRFRLLCTATAAPNDFIELGTSSEALGELTHSEMLKRFFRQLDDKGQKNEAKKQDFAEKVEEMNEKAGVHYGKLSFRVAQTIGQWRLKHHARRDYWRWVASWARACRKPSDVGFSDEGYNLPPLVENSHTVAAEIPRDGWLFTLPAFGLGEEREERKHTLNERCELAARLVDHDRPAVVWCHTNAEGDLLERIIPGSRQIAGRTPPDEKEEIYREFESGDLRVLVIKPKIGAWGLNWQHCNHVVTFASHSYEQYYQSIRRCWRFGQTRPVTVDVIASEGEVRVLENMKRKAYQADVMFDALVREMNNALKIEVKERPTTKAEIPGWL
jgi:hypothetical protein